jgi:hypothetical protein
VRREMLITVAEVIGGIMMLLQLIYDRQRSGYRGSSGGSSERRSYRSAGRGKWLESKELTDECHKSQFMMQRTHL